MGIGQLLFLIIFFAGIPFAMLVLWLIWTNFTE